MITVVVASIFVCTKFIIFIKSLRHLALAKNFEDWLTE